jgi:hypothetical protein
VFYVEHNAGNAASGQKNRKRRSYRQNASKGNGVLILVVDGRFQFYGAAVPLWQATPQTPPGIIGIL